MPGDVSELGDLLELGSMPTVVGGMSKPKAPACPRPGWPRSFGPGVSERKGQQKALLTEQGHPTSAWRRCAWPCHPCMTFCLTTMWSLLTALLLVSYAVAQSEPTNQIAEAVPIPRRIVTIAPNAAEVICALGAGEAIVGVSKFCVYPPELVSRPRVGGLFDPNLEKIVALRPDLIVLRGHNEEVEQLCKARGIRVFQDRTEKLEDVTNNVKALGRLLHREEQAQQLVGDYEARLAAVRARTAPLKRPRVLLTVSRNADELANILTAGKGAFLDEMVTIAGGTNVFGHVDAPYPQVALEEIAARRPEVILEMMPEAEPGEEANQRRLAQWQSLATIPAVATGRIHFITDDHALIPSLRYVEIIERVSRLLHPEADVDD